MNRWTDEFFCEVFYTDVGHIKLFVSQKFVSVKPIEFGLEEHFSALAKKIKLKKTSCEQKRISNQLVFETKTQILINCLKCVETKHKGLGSKARAQSKSSYSKSLTKPESWLCLHQCSMVKLGRAVKNPG